MARHYWKLHSVEDDEWIVDTKNQLADIIEKRRGIEKGNVWPTVRPIDPWVDPLPMECASPGPFYDMASCASQCIVMSDRFKDVVERIGPGAVQFLPVQPTYRRKRLPCGIYWAGNVISAYDCLDVEASGCEQSRYPDCYGHDRLTPLSIIDSKVPEDASIFQLHKLLNRWIVTDRLKRAMQAAKLTGIRYLKP
jgi:hypothetical protein